MLDVWTARSEAESWCLPESPRCKWDIDYNISI